MPITGFQCGWCRASTSGAGGSDAELPAYSALSAFNSLSLSPALAALLLKPHEARQDWGSRGLDFTLGWFFRLFNRAFDATNRGYIRMLRHVVRFGIITLVVYGGLVYLAYLGFSSVPTGFIPSQDQGYLVVNLQMPDASSIERTEALMDSLAVITRKARGVHDAFTVELIMATGAGAGAEMRQALGTVVFFGMLGVTFFGVFLTPVFYTEIRKLTRHDVLPPTPGIFDGLPRTAAGTVSRPERTTPTRCGPMYADLSPVVDRSSAGKTHRSPSIDTQAGAAGG